MQLPEVDTEPQATIFLPDQDYCASPQTVPLMDNTDIQHFLDMGPHVIVHMRGYAPVMLFEGHLIH